MYVLTILLVTWVGGAAGAGVGQFFDTTPDLTCGVDTMRVTWTGTAPAGVSKIYVGGDSFKNDANCIKTTFSANTFIEWNLENCGNAVAYDAAEASATNLVYTNTIIGVPLDSEKGTGTGAGLISRGHVIKTLVSCSYSRTGSTDTVNWKAGQAETDDSETGSFTFTLKGYTKGTRQSTDDLDSLSGYVNLRDTLYFTVNVNVPQALKVGMTIVDVTACSTSSCGNSDSKYEIAKGGCAYDTTYESEDPANILERRFNFDAFYFTGAETDPVYVKVDLKLCKHNGNTATDTAYQGCMASCSEGGGTQARKRRSAPRQKRENGKLTGQSAQLMGKYSVYGGPYMIRDPNSAASVTAPCLALILAILAAM